MKINTIIKRTTSHQSLFSWQAAFLSGALFLIVSLAGCSQNDDNTSDALGNAVNFNAGIFDATALPSPTRTTGNGESWTTNDQVGLFMLTTGGNLSTDIITSNGTMADNVQYNVTNASTGALSPAGGTTLYYPQSPNVDFIAYYPYGTPTTAHTYAITVNGQTDETAQNKLDVLYAKATDKAKTETAVNLTFKHALSKVTLNVTLGEGLTSLSGSDITTAVFCGMPQTAQLALQDGALTTGAAGNFPALRTATTATYAATFTSLLIPQTAGGTSRTAVITVAGEPYIWSISDADVFAPGKHYTYNIIVQMNGIVIAGAPKITPWNTQDNGSGTVEEIGKGIEKVKIPAGTFLMGSSDGSMVGIGIPDVDPNATPAEPGRISNGLKAETQHKVTLTKDFWMSKYEITNSQYAAFLNANNIGDDGVGSVTYEENGSLITVTQHFVYSNDWGVTYDGTDWVPQAGYENHPIISVTWYGAKAFADWVGGALPTEAQWEYACRSGKANKPFGIGTGYKLDNTLANFDWEISWEWDGSSNSYPTFPNTGTAPLVTQRVGLYPPNAWNLYDMHGNVEEWCSDCFRVYDNSIETDPVGNSGSKRVIRGGSFINFAFYCRSAYRFNATSPFNSSNNLGFRVIFVP